MLRVIQWNRTTLQCCSCRLSQSWMEKFDNGLTEKSPHFAWISRPAFYTIPPDMTALSPLMTYRIFAEILKLSGWAFCLSLPISWNSCYCVVTTSPVSVLEQTGIGHRWRKMTDTEKQHRKRQLSSGDRCRSHCYDRRAAEFFPSGSARAKSTETDPRSFVVSAGDGTRFH